MPLNWNYRFSMLNVHNRQSLEESVTTLFERIRLFLNRTDKEQVKCLWWTLQQKALSYIVGPSQRLLSKRKRHGPY